MLKYHAIFEQLAVSLLDECDAVNSTKTQGLVMLQWPRAYDHEHSTQHKETILDIAALGKNGNIVSHRTAQEALKDRWQGCIHERSWYSAIALAYLFPPIVLLCWWMENHGPFGGPITFRGRFGKKKRRRRTDDLQPRLSSFKDEQEKEPPKLKTCETLKLLLWNFYSAPVTIFLAHFFMYILLVLLTTYNIFEPYPEPSADGMESGEWSSDKLNWTEYLMVRFSDFI